MDTIFALSTAQGRAALAVVRISGPAARAAGVALAGPLALPRVMSLRRLVWQGDILDEAFVVLFERGRSYTGEDVVELHLHGGRAVVRRVLDVLAGMEGLRPAEAGEFTRRALEAGRVDLNRVEGIADLIDAETEAQRRQAIRELSGALSERAADWRRQLVQAEALLAAEIDFADEDLPPGQRDLLVQILCGLVRAWRAEIGGAEVAERVRDGFEVAIVGVPNAGKSTLLNAIAGRRAAITSPIPGTTRDVIEVRMDLGGIPVTFLDTAGLRSSQDPIEQEGVARALERAGQADLRIVLVDGEGVPPQLALGGDDLVVRGKIDLDHGIDGVSGLTGQGVGALLEEVRSRLEVRMAGIGAITRLRHRAALMRGLEALEGAEAGLAAGEPAEVVAERVRQARRSVEELVGRVDLEDILGEVFSRFCIGK